VATVVGGGILGLPYALAESGWFGVVVLLMVAIMANYTAKKLSRCMYVKKPFKKLKTYQEVGGAAFGRAGSIISVTLQYITLLSVGTLFLLLASKNIQLLVVQTWHFTEWSLTTCTLITAAISFPFLALLKSIREISIIAFFGMIASAFIVVVIVIFAMRYPDDDVEYQFLNAKKLPFAFSTMVFSFAGHSVL